MDVLLKFPRDEAVTALGQGEQVDVRVGGRLLGCHDTLSCLAHDTIRLIQPHVVHPVAGQQVMPLSVVEIVWTLPSELAMVDSVVVLASVDNQQTWAVVGSGPGVWSTCEWVAPEAVAESCYVAIVAYADGEVLGVGYGGPFRVDALTAVVPGLERFGLQGARPHPFRPGGRIAFAVPVASAVTLQVFDLGGRLMETLVDGPMAAGRHEVAWEARAVAAGVYFVELRSGVLREHQRLVVVR